MGKVACIIGAGPAGLTAALELIKHTDIKPIVLEKSGFVGGLSRTAEHNGNRIDIGGHRFFSKSERVMKLWRKMLPEGTVEQAENKDEVMLVRNRLSRILFLRKFFDYPLSLDTKTLGNLGLVRTAKIGTAYLRRMVCPVKPERSLEDFFTNRFGDELYKTFFEGYTEKVWGVPCREIPRDWGAQRVKGVSVGEVILHAIRKRFGDANKKETETSLIDQFWYPKYGPGQLWERMAEKVVELGGEIRFEREVVQVVCENDIVKKVVSYVGNHAETIQADYVFSSMPVKDLVLAMDHGYSDVTRPEKISSDIVINHFVPDKVADVTNKLVYRDFITVGVLLNYGDVKALPDNWIYIQERDVKVGRVQVFNNWSPFMVKNKFVVWLGLEYFANEGDELWQKSEDEMKALAVEELKKIGFIYTDKPLDMVVLKVPKAYPAYFGSYKDFGVVREYVDQFKNLFLIGRNGMHRYNNMDHSMLSAMVAVDNVAAGRTNKDNIWGVNTEEEYHESE